jgi:hypothetical protein
MGIMDFLQKKGDVANLKGTLGLKKRPKAPQSQKRDKYGG